MTPSTAAAHMIAFYRGDLHDINHFLKVWTFARIIGEQEQLDPHTQLLLELTAIVHDIACPLCRQKYGSADGKKQELESLPLIEAFFSSSQLPPDDIRTIGWLVAHHHTYTDVTRPEHQILLEADYLVNADESGASAAAIRNACAHFFRTKAGIRLLQSVYPAAAT